MYYDIIKTLHLVSVISWMVGLLYLPRLFVYHHGTKYESQTDKIFLLMEFRLLKIIMKPAMVLTYIFGFLLVYDNSYIVSEVYFILKLFFVVFLTVFHLYLSNSISISSNMGELYLSLYGTCPSPVTVV